MFAPPQYINKDSSVVLIILYWVNIDILRMELWHIVRLLLIQSVDIIDLQNLITKAFHLWLTIRQIPLEK